MDLGPTSPETEDLTPPFHLPLLRNTALSDADVDDQHCGTFTGPEPGGEAAAAVVLGQIRPVASPRPRRILGETVSEIKDYQVLICPGDHVPLCVSRVTAGFAGTADGSIGVRRCSSPQS